MKDLYKDELAHDIRMLKKPWQPDSIPINEPNPFANASNPFSNDFWFKAKSMSNETGHPLEWLSTYAYAHLNSFEIGSIEGLVEDDTFLRTRTEYWNDASRNPWKLIPYAYYNSRTNYQCHKTWKD